MTQKKAAGDSPDFPRGVSQPAIRALHSVGISRLEECSKFTEAELAALHGMGPKALGIIRDALEASGADFAKAND